MNFVSIMGAHVVPIKDMQVPRVRTGYESVLPVRTGDNFCLTAEEDGVVTAVDNKAITVKYNSGKVKNYLIKTWTSKEEAGTCYTYSLIPNLKKGDSFNKDDTLLYNPLFFEPDIFNPKRVLYKQGTMVTVAIKEDPETYEDSGAISKALTERMSTSITKVISVVITKDDSVGNVSAIGTHVEPHSVLFSFMDSEFEHALKDPKVMEILKDLKTSSPKAKVRGVVSNIVVYYNCELNEIKSKALLNLIKESNARLQQNKEVDSGRVNSSYSISGKPLLPGEIEIKFYISVGEGMSIGDKAIIGNQLKFTVGNIFTNKKYAKESGDPIDVEFGFISIKNRIVMSPDLLGTTSQLLEVLQKRMVEMYYKK